MNCSKAQTKLEKLICSTPELKNLDAKLNLDYSALIKRINKESAAIVKSSQKLWHARQFSSCDNAACAKSALQSRIAHLNDDYDDCKWVQKYKKASASEVMSDVSSNDLLARLGWDYSADFGFKKKNQKSTLSEALAEALSGTPDPVLNLKEEQFTVSGCRAQSCLEKAWLWLDTAEMTSGGVAAIVSYVFNGRPTSTPQLLVFSPSEENWNSVSADAKGSLKAWLKSHDVKPSVVRYLSKSGIQEIQLEK